MAGTLLGWLAGGGAAAWRGILPLAAGALVLGAVGLWDDLRGDIGPLPRLLLQTGLAAAIVLLWGGMQVLPFPSPFDLAVEFWGVPLAILWIVGVVNLYNFLDGIDGYAGTQTIAAVWVFLLALRPAPPLWVLGMALTGACAGFLYFNWHPARLFMGNSGSYSLGFLLAAMPFVLPASERSAGIFAMAMGLWFFLSDGTFTLLRRALKGERVWRAHRSHLYQRLNASGLAPDRIVPAFLAALLPLGLLTVWALRSTPRRPGWAPLAYAFAILAAAWAWTALRERTAARRP